MFGEGCWDGVQIAFWRLIILGSAKLVRLKLMRRRGDVLMSR